MGIVRQVVERQVGAFQPRQMLRGRNRGCEDQPLGIDAGRLRLAPQVIRISRIVARQQPKHTARRLRQDSHPARKGVGRKLVAAVEIAEDECAIGQAASGAGRRLARDVAA